MNTLYTHRSDIIYVCIMIYSGQGHKRRDKKQTKKKIEFLIAHFLHVYEIRVIIYFTGFVYGARIK